MFAIRETSLVDWSTLREADGPATSICFALNDLVQATDPPGAESAYWRLENHVVVQGQLFECALAVIPVLLAALVDNTSRPARISMMELMFQIVSGEAHETEVKFGNADLGEACRARAREGLWLLYRELAVGQRASARDILEVIEENPSRLRSALDSFGGDP